MNDLEKAALLRLSNNKDFQTILSVLDREHQDVLKRLVMAVETPVLYRAQGEAKGLSWLQRAIDSIS